LIDAGGHTPGMLHDLTAHIARARPFVLAIGLACVVLLTVPGIPLAEFRLAEVALWTCLLYFLAEWVIDVAIRLSAPPPRRLVSYMDLFYASAVLPVPIAHLVGVSPASAWLLAGFWLLKLEAAQAGFSLMRRVFITEAKPIATVVFGFIVVQFLAAIAMHLAERVAQPTVFGTLPQALYWAVTTLSTTGYGDVVPVTQLGRTIAGLVMICGIAMFGLWTGILANGFAAETRRRDFTRVWEFVARVPFFKVLNPGAIIEIARMLRAQDFPERAVIIRKGRHGESMFFIAAGQVEIVGTNPPVRLGEGAFFGELALLGGGVRTATVVATMPTTLLVLDLADYRIFAASHPDLARAVEEEAARRLAEIRGERPTATPARPAAAGDIAPSE
jgi:voltage-gated potassium channel